MSTVPEAFISRIEGTENAVPTALVPQPTAGWQRELSQAIRSVDELLRRVGLTTHGETATFLVEELQLLPTDADVLRRFPVLVPESFLARMRMGDPSDPLLLQVLPLATESTLVAGFVADAVGDLQARREAGILQKYAGRVLLIATGACAVHCRYCFRREYPYSAEPKLLPDWLPAIEVLASDTTVSEVIFSGGDPLMLSDSRLQSLCAPIDSIPHIERIRFHTRLPIVLPSRVTDEFTAMLLKLRAQPIIVVHANHGNEIVGDCAEALRKLVRSGIPVLNQAVLLRGINDTTDDQEHLSRRLINIGVMPYYLHQLDRVSGAQHFEVAPERGLQIIEELAARLPGYAVPKYVQELSGEPNKRIIGHNA